MSRLAQRARPAGRQSPCLTLLCCPPGRACSFQRRRRASRRSYLCSPVRHIVVARLGQPVGAALRYAPGSVVPPAPSDWRLFALNRIIAPACTAGGSVGCASPETGPWPATRVLRCAPHRISATCRAGPAPCSSLDSTYGGELGPEYRAGEREKSLYAGGSFLADSGGSFLAAVQYSARSWNGPGAFYPRMPWRPGHDDLT